ncbi:MAG: hypothetical protein JWQ57_4315 [Mucilaginibacter sp.]|nr:hypothetical protein [Mucilaginibacter sp.]
MINRIKGLPGFDYPTGESNPKNPIKFTKSRFRQNPLANGKGIFLLSDNLKLKPISCMQTYQAVVFQSS